MDTKSTDYNLGTALVDIKFLFRSRKYTICAAKCASILEYGSQNGYEIHPVHLAYFHFYQALCHDCLAREKNITSPNRPPALNLAEKHYLSAISALTFPNPRDSHPRSAAELEPECPHPNPLDSEDGVSSSSSRRPSATPSIHSIHSSVDASSTAPTSVAGEDLYDSSSDCEPTPTRSHLFNRLPPSRNILDGFTMTPKLLRTSPSSPSSFSPGHLVAYNEQAKSFLEMVHSHLASVRELKEAPVASPSPLPRSRDSLFFSKPRNRDSRAVLADEREMEKIREARKRVVLRSRFDPTSVRELCSYALAEL
ncbi:hypothetical protein GQ43DRAFT_84121 [Delitschia confertaspora ATCC 74209]|uniref:Uncharacterized protein n=1 Tax=Delitschia confertaspora ATCC 74209 TaxID=1513339 RepID=A0A9P4JL60_9PLEO|nr:hypothetical protein GQ43DRAFT_84121 [Delitschia confertaspora ATCC 74209]